MPSDPATILQLLRDAVEWLQDGGDVEWLYGGDGSIIGVQLRLEVPSERKLLGPFPTTAP